MNLVLFFDLNADLIEVPQSVIDNKDKLQKQFYRWIYNKNNNHQYWVHTIDISGKPFVGLMYRSDAFVDWLNKKVLNSSTEKAVIVETNTTKDIDGLPTLFF